jgi:LacI family transcriptional regulator
VLGYVPSEVGRSLATRSTRRIGIVAAELTNPFYPHLVEPLHRAFEDAGYRSALYIDRTDDAITVQELADGSLDGVVLTTATVDSVLPRALEDRGIPVVLVNREVDDVATDVVVADNRHGAQMLADLLVQLGHRRIGGVFGPSWTSTGREREEWFVRTLSRRGVHLKDDLVVRSPFGVERGREAIKSLVAAPEPPTAVFAGNDVLALGIIDGAAEMDVSVPGDLTVVGFDDISEASWHRFSLTTVRCNLPRMARSAAEMLLSRLAEPGQPPRRLVLPTEVVLRGSHSAPSAQP